MQKQKNRQSSGPSQGKSELPIKTFAEEIRLIVTEKKGAFYQSKGIVVSQFGIFQQSRFRLNDQSEWYLKKASLQVKSFRLRTPKKKANQ